MSEGNPPKRQKRYVRGPKSLHVPVDRTVKHFAISEHELTTIGICNAQVAIWSSVASAALALLAACLWDMCTTEMSNKPAAVAFIVGTGFVAVVSGVIAYRHHVAKRNEIQSILDETDDASGDSGD